MDDNLLDTDAAQGYGVDLVAVAVHFVLLIGEEKKNRKNYH